MTPRAPAMSVEDRRAALVEATIPLLLARGRAVTTGEIARAAGVAEGTIFRAFASKDELIDVAVATALDPGPYLADLEAIDRRLPTHERVLAIATAMERRFRGVFAILAGMGMMPPRDHPSQDGWRERAHRLVVDLLGDAEEFRVPPPVVAHYLRLLAFVGNHTKIADGHLLTAEEITDLLLDGIRKD